MGIIDTLKRYLGINYEERLEILIAHRKAEQEWNEQDKAELDTLFADLPTLDLRKVRDLAQTVPLADRWAYKFILPSFVKTGERIKGTNIPQLTNDIANGGTLYGFPVEVHVDIEIMLVPRGWVLLSDNPRR